MPAAFGYISVLILSLHLTHLARFITVPNQRVFIGWCQSITCASAHNKETIMNKAEYNRKMKAFNRDIERFNSELETLNEKQRDAWVRKVELVFEGWDE